ncbi:MAG: hypothetical protein ACRDP1_00980 [Nocardioidaceae bacterium]
MTGNPVGPVADIWQTSLRGAINASDQATAAAGRAPHEFGPRRRSVAVDGDARMHRRGFHT